MNSRVLTALVALPILVLSILLPVFLPQVPAANWLFVLIAALALGAGLFEFFTLTKKLELKADASIAYIGAAFFFVAFIFDAPRNAPDLLILTIVLFLIIVLISQTFRFQADFSKMLTGIGVTILGVLYVAFFGGFIVSMRVGFYETTVPFLSTKLLAFFFLIVMGADTGALLRRQKFRQTQTRAENLAGKNMGRRDRRTRFQFGFCGNCDGDFFPRIAV